MIEAAYKKEYQDDFLTDCWKYTYNRIISRILSIDNESRYGKIISERLGDIDGFKGVKDAKQRAELKRNAKKQRTKFRKEYLKIKNDTPKVENLNISQFYD